jgi:hypothetical protein
VTWIIKPDLAKAERQFGAKITQFLVFQPDTSILGARLPLSLGLLRLEAFQRVQYCTGQSLCNPIWSHQFSECGLYIDCWRASLGRWPRRRSLRTAKLERMLTPDKYQQSRWMIPGGITSRMPRKSPTKVDGIASTFPVCLSTPLFPGLSDFFNFILTNVRVVVCLTYYFRLLIMLIIWV